VFTFESSVRLFVVRLFMVRTFVVRSSCTPNPEPNLNVNTNRAVRTEKL